MSKAAIFAIVLSLIPAAAMASPRGAMPVAPGRPSIPFDRPIGRPSLPAYVGVGPVGYGNWWPVANWGGWGWGWGWNQPVTERTTVINNAPPQMAQPQIPVVYGAVHLVDSSLRYSDVPASWKKTVNGKPVVETPCGSVHVDFMDNVSRRAPNCPEAKLVKFDGGLRYADTLVFDASGKPVGYKDE